MLLALHSLLAFLMCLGPRSLASFLDKNKRLTSRERESKELHRRTELTTTVGNNERTKGRSPALESKERERNMVLAIKKQSGGLGCLGRFESCWATRVA